MLIQNRTANYTVAGICGLLGAAFALVAFGSRHTAHPPTAGDRVGAGLAVIGFAVVAFRALRMGVEVGPHTLTLRGFGSTKVVSWEQVRDLSVVDSGNVTGRATCVALILTSGEVVRAMATASFRSAKVHAMLTALAQARPRQSL